MTKEELLKPRYKVIADYPDNPWNIGDILYPFDDTTNQFLGLKDFSKYPKVFQPLPWWSDRKPEDMPEYLKVVNMISYPSDIGHIFQALPGAYRKGTPFGYRCFYEENIVSGFDNIMISCFEPATKEEYEQYISKS